MIIPLEFMNKEGRALFSAAGAIQELDDSDLVFAAEFTAGRADLVVEIPATSESWDDLSNAETAVDMLTEETYRVVQTTRAGKLSSARVTLATRN